MRIQRTIPVLVAQDPDLIETVLRYTWARNIASEYCFNGGGRPLSRGALQESAYREIREATGLSAQMACSVCRSVAAAYIVREKRIRKRDRERARALKAGKKPPRSLERRAIVFDRPVALFLVGPQSRDAGFRQDGTVSISTAVGRKHLAYSVPDAFRERFSDAVSLDSLTLRVIDGRLRGHLALTLEAPEPAGIRPVGVDLNETNLIVAVDSEGREFFHDGVPLKARNKRKRQVRKRLQQKLESLKAQEKDTHSVRRLLKRLGESQSNCTRNECRVAAKRLVAWAGEDSVLILENLHPNPVSKRDFTKRRTTRRRLNSGFPYLQLRQAIESRCALLGVPVEFVNPAYTSQRCNACGNLGIRHRHEFSCPSCKHTDHADINAARNLRNMSSLGATGRPSIVPEARSCGQAVAQATAIDEMSHVASQGRGDEGSLYAPAGGGTSPAAHGDVAS